MTITHTEQGDDIKTTIVILSSEPRYKELMELVEEIKDERHENEKKKLQ